MPSKMDVFVIASSTAAAIEPIASVATNEGMPTSETATPFASPASAPAPIATAIASQTGASRRNAIAPTPAGRYSQPDDEAHRQVELADDEHRSDADREHAEHRGVVEDRARVVPGQERVRPRDREEGERADERDQEASSARRRPAD